VGSVGLCFSSSFLYACCSDRSLGSVCYSCGKRAACRNVGQRQGPGVGPPARQAKWWGPAGRAAWDGEGRFTGAGRGRWVRVVSMSFVSSQRSLAFHHEAHGGPQIISVTAVTVPRVRSFTTLYTLLKKTSCSFKQLVLLRGFFLPGATAGAGQRHSGQCWGWSSCSGGQAVGWKLCGARCCGCQGVGAASRAKEERVASVCESLFRLSVQSLAAAGPGRRGLVTPGESCARPWRGDRDQLCAALLGHSLRDFPAGASLEAVFCGHLWVKCPSIKPCLSNQESQPSKACKACKNLIVF